MFVNKMWEVARRVDSTPQHYRSFISCSTLFANLVLSRRSQSWSKNISFALPRENTNDIRISIHTEAMIMEGKIKYKNYAFCPLHTVVTKQTNMAAKSTSCHIYMYIYIFVVLILESLWLSCCWEELYLCRYCFRGAK